MANVGEDAEEGEGRALSEGVQPGTDAVKDNSNFSLPNIK